MSDEKKETESTKPAPIFITGIDRNPSAIDGFFRSKVPKIPVWVEPEKKEAK